MTHYRRLIELDRGWEQVLAGGGAKCFDIMGVAKDGSRVRIRNSDNTITVLEGEGLAVSGDDTASDGDERRLTAGKIAGLKRLAADGALIEEVTGLEMPAAGEADGPSFSHPPHPLSSLAFALNGHGSTVPAATPAEAADFEQAAAEPAGAPPEVVGMRQAVGLHGRSVTPRAVLILLAPVLLAVVAAMWLTTDAADGERGRIKWKFARPTTIPYPADNVPSAARVELGRRLFNDGRLSVDGTVSCASCHNPKLGFADGLPFGQGVTRTKLGMHTPTLWNLAWGNAMFWDGRLPTLEAQALAPIQNPVEMGSSLEEAVARLRGDAGYVAAFAAAFPEAPEITPLALGKALASYQRTIVSPPTRFDRWIEGNPTALTASEKNGFSIFVGKAGCVNCHSGWAFTDYAFHDIGLATTAKGRGHVLKRPTLDYAFKTPTLREVVWSAPYMHNGSMSTLEQVVRHYETGGVDRPTRSPDMPRRIRLADTERNDLIAFIRSLSSERPPQPALESASTQQSAAQAALTEVPKVGQKDKRF